MSWRFLQFDHYNRCPSCGQVHQMDLLPTCGITINSVGVCETTGKQMFLNTKDAGKSFDKLGRLAMGLMALRDDRVLSILE